MPAVGLWHVWGLCGEPSTARGAAAVGGARAAPDAPHREAARLHQEPLRVREEGGVREAGGPAAGPLWEAAQGQGQSGWRGALRSRPASPGLGRDHGAPVCGQLVQVPAGVHDGIDDWEAESQAGGAPSGPPRPPPTTVPWDPGVWPHPPSSCFCTRRSSFRMELISYKCGGGAVEQAGWATTRPRAPRLRQPWHSRSGQLPTLSQVGCAPGTGGARVPRVPQAPPASPCWTSSGWAPRSPR